jgi:hypothetical protein
MARTVGHVAAAVARVAELLGAAALDRQNTDLRRRRRR